MKKPIINGIIFLAVALLSPQITQAQGTTYMSDLGLHPTGSLAVGSDSWQGNEFTVGTNAGGYVFNSVQLAMADASGNPGGFTVMLYENWAGPSFGGHVGSNIVTTLIGSSNPSTAGIYTYTPPANLTLSQSYIDSIVVTAGTAVANGSYNWSGCIPAFNELDGWRTADVISQSSDDGSSWSQSFSSSVYPQFAINATAVPEPGVFGLLALGGLFFGLRRSN